MRPADCSTRGINGREYRWNGGSMEEPLGISTRGAAFGERHYQFLFESIDAGFCTIEVLFDEGRPVDYVFLEVNPAFETQTGLHDAVGRRMRDLAPAHEESWF